MKLRNAAIAERGSCGRSGEQKSGAATETQKGNLLQIFTGESGSDTTFAGMKRHRIYLLLGSNLGARMETMERAIGSIEKKLGPVKAASSYYHSKPWGPVEQPDFLNRVILVESEAAPRELLRITQEIEAAAGPPKARKWGPRHLDIDILFYDELRWHSEELKIPHPELHKRNFTLRPLAEIAPDLVHPVLKQSMSELLAQSPDPENVVPWNEA